MSVLEQPLDNGVIEDIYLWIDQIPLSRPKRNFARDFSDGGENSMMISYFMKLTVFNQF